MFSSRSFLRGLVGVIPVAIGLACCATTFLYGSFRFMDVPTTVFTFFYQMQGDTYFDSGTSARLENTLAALFFYVLVNNYFIFGFMKVALAQVEEGYLTARWRSDSDWLSKSIVLDPGVFSEFDQLQQTAITIPDILRKIILRKTIYNQPKKVTGMHELCVADEDGDGERRIPPLAEREEIERYLKNEH